MAALPQAALNTILQRSARWINTTVSVGPSLTRMVQGRGAFLDDIKLPGMCFAVFVRSQYAHANIKSINVDEALNVPGAIGVHHPRRGPALR